MARGFSAGPGAAHVQVIITLIRAVFSPGLSFFFFTFFLKEILEKQKRTPPHFLQSTVAPSDLGT